MTDRFEKVGIERAHTDAQELLSHALGCTRLELFVDHDRPVASTERGSLRELCRRRLAREPVAYIEQRRGFHALDLDLMVDARVMVPRPETEHLVDWLLEDLADATEGARVLDVGTGSGAIALAIKHARRHWAVVAVDRSHEALELAAANAERLDLELELHQGDLLAAAPPGPWDAIIANLPYIPTGELETLEPEVRDFEPRAALDGGPDGLEIVGRFIGQLAEASLGPRARVYLEIGSGQAAAVMVLLEDRGYQVSFRRDLAGHERMVSARPAG